MKSNQTTYNPLQTVAYLNKQSLSVIHPYHSQLSNKYKHLILKSFTLYQNVIYTYTLGRPSEGNGRPKQLQYATMPVISDIKCVKPHAYWNKTMITSNMICAQGFNTPLFFIKILLPLNPSFSQSGPLLKNECFYLSFKIQSTLHIFGTFIHGFLKILLPKPSRNDFRFTFDLPKIFKKDFFARIEKKMSLS